MGEIETANQVDLYTETKYGWYSFICGITLGSLLIISSIIFHFAGFSDSKIPEFVQYILMISLLSFFQIKYRNEKLGGAMPFKIGLGMGTLVIVYSGILLALYMYVFMKFVDDSVIQTILKRVNKDIVLNDLSEDQAVRSIGRLKKMVIPSVIAGVFFFFIIAIGSIFALITSLFVKRKF